MQNKYNINEVLSYLPREIKCLLEKITIDKQIKIEEIRLRSGAPLAIEAIGKSFFIAQNGNITNDKNYAYIVSQETVQKSFMSVCENSVYAHINELLHGFITIKGGHRVGICGKAIMEDNKIKVFKEISSMNFRIANEIIGVANNIINSIVDNSGIHSTIIISPPQAGKTTLLRDITRQVSDRGFKTAVADDRGELAAMYNGVPQNNIGAQTDVIDNVPKGQAILMFLKTMSPRVIISDEIASEEDVNAIRLACGTGVSIIATTHGNNIDEVKKRSVLQPLFYNKVFKQAIILERKLISSKSVTYTKTVTL